MHESTQSTRTEDEHSTESGKSPSGIFHSLTAFQRDILTILAGREAPAGVDVRADLIAYYETSVEHSRLYQALTKLADKHLVNISEKDGHTNAYQLTRHGERALAVGKAFKAMVGGEVDE